MKFKTALIIALIAACIAPSISQAKEKKGPDPAKAFQKLDADQNGEISKEEAKGNKGLTKRFDQADLDKNSTISLAEFSEYNAKRMASKKKKGAADSAE